MLVFDQLKKNDPQLRLLTAGVLVGLFVLLAGLWWVQIVSAQDYQQHLETQAFRTVRIPAVRGKILDRNGAALAENAPNYSVSLYLDDLRGDFQKEYTRLRPAKLVTNSPPFWKFWNRKRSVQSVRVRLTKDQINALTWQARYDVASNVVAEVGQRLRRPVSLDFRDFAQHYREKLALPYPVVANIDPNLVARFEEQAIAPDGVDLDVQSMRYYPLHNTAVHLLGHLQFDDSSAEGEESYFTYRLPDYRGAVGIEYAFDPYLRGHAGGKSVLVNNQGYRQSESVWEPAEPGSNVVLTLDLQIQHAAERALQHGPQGEKTEGAVVVMDVNTGDVLAMASSPSFDPNYYIDRQSFPPDYYANVVQTDGAEKNRATQENYRPGSIFKPIVALACLENGMNPDAIYDLQPNPRDSAHGYIQIARNLSKRDTAPPGKYNFKRALIHSSNGYFIYHGLMAGNLQKIVELGHEFHLGERMGLGTRQETPGLFPDQKRIHSGWTINDTADLCIGQGYIDVTPLQMCVVASALANGGKVLWPRLVDSIVPQDPLSDGQAIHFPKAQVRDTVNVRPNTFRILREAMLDDTESSEGTAYAAFRGSPVNTELRVCGKTGTAQNEHDGGITYTTWFLSFAPYEHPHYAVVVMVENGSSGGGTCAPIAREVYEAILKKGQSNPAARNLAGN
ncbi:MAG TPA: penicillin-binding transpeptidase domain-containing protein [Verrucomicrobiae bacterium]|jgi:penicillin-binding protein 2|nr:penicillin-binding transpeptidase domain-containing protein [Verrucomicrobiae bacterium]